MKSILKVGLQVPEQFNPSKMTGWCLHLSEAFSILLPAKNKKKEPLKHLVCFTLCSMLVKAGNQMIHLVQEL